MHSDEAMTVATTGLVESVRAKVSAAYRKHGGSFSRVNVPLLRLALRDVRRRLEDSGRYVAASELTKREDALAASQGE